MKIRRIAGIAASLGVAVSMVACSAGGTAGPQQSPITRAETTAPGVTGLPEVVWNLPYGEPTSLDPAFSSSESISTVVANMCESLLLLNPDFTTSDNLASVEMVDDKTYKVTLDERAVFWDGSPVTSDDVKFSFGRTADPEVGSTWASVLSNIASIDIISDAELAINMAQPDVLFAAHLATPAATIVQRKYVESDESFGTSAGGLMCTGPFEFESWNIGQSIVLNKTANYWNPDAGALSDSLRFTFNTDAASAATALQNGEITGSYNFPVSALDILQASKGTITFGTSLGLYGLMTINTDAGPLADIKVREALQLAIDYEGVRDGIFAEAAETMRTFTPKSAWGYSVPTFESAWDAIEAGITDIDRAKQLVSESAAQERPIVLAYYADLPEDAQVASSVQAAAKEIGLDVEVRAQTSAENIAMYFDAEARDGVDLMIWAGYLDVPEPAAYYQYYTSEGVFNVAGFSDTEFDELVYGARSTVDDDVRARMIVEAQTMYSENRINLPILSQFTRLYMTAGVSGAIASQAFYYSPWAAKVGSTNEG